MGGLSVKELCESLPEVRGEEISGCHKKKKNTSYFFQQQTLIIYQKSHFTKIDKKEKGMEVSDLHHLNVDDA